MKGVSLGEKLKSEGPKKDCTLCTGRLDPRDLKAALFWLSFLRKGEVLAYVGRIHNLKDLKLGV